MTYRTVVTEERSYTVTSSMHKKSGYDDFIEIIEFYIISEIGVVFFERYRIENYFLNCLRCVFQQKHVSVVKTVV